MLRRDLTQDFVGQFVLGTTPGHSPEGWPTRCLGSWWLACHPSLPVIEISAPGGRRLGWFLGFPVSPEAKLVSRLAEVPAPDGAADDPAVFERWLYGHGGRFAAVYLSPRASRVYVDAGATLGVVYAPEQGIVASTTNLIPVTAATRYDTELADVLDVVGRDRWYPFALTPRRGVERLLPNHFLDLAAWKAARHWPRVPDLAVHEDVRDGAAEIAALMENTIAAVTDAYPAHMGLTAGRHTRMMLACARRCLPAITFFTVPLPEPQGKRDCAVATRVARRFGLRYEPMRWEEPSTVDIDEWLYRTGECVAGRTLRTVRALRALDPTRCILSGALGAVGEAVWWDSDDPEKGALSLPDLLARAGMPPAPVLLDRAARWLDELPTRNILSILDFLHFEQRLGAWVGPQEYGHISARFVVSPFCYRRVLQLKLTLPPNYRKRDRLPGDLMRERWPELLEFPFNGNTTMHRVLGLSQRATTRALALGRRWPTALLSSWPPGRTGTQLNVRPRD